MPFFLGVTGLAFFLRFFWLLDMEFKGDERSGAQFIRHLGQMDYSPLAPIAEHSGFAHSSGFYYLIHWLSFGSGDPLVMASIIAGLNALAIVALLWLSKNSKAGRLTALMCATSFGLVLASRKIWTPDLIAPWVILSLGLLIYVQGKTIGTRVNFALGLSAFSILLSGHMYLPGLSVAVGANAAVALWFLIQKHYSRLFAWISGCILGVLSWVPYAYLLATHAPGAFSPDPLIVKSSQAPFSISRLFESMSSAITLPSPFSAAQLYIFTSYKQIKAIASEWLFYPLIGLLGVLIVLWIGLYLVSLLRIWQRRAEAMKEPLIWASLSAIGFTIVALQIVKLGDWPHYWFGCIPFAYYIIAWAGADEHVFGQWLRRLIYAGSVGTTVVILLFFGLVRQTGGFPQEYKTSYRTQLIENRVGSVD